jgi:hypothetical protein
MKGEQLGPTVHVFMCDKQCHRTINLYHKALQVLNAGRKNATGMLIDSMSRNNALLILFKLINYSMTAAHLKLCTKVKFLQDR